MDTLHDGRRLPTDEEWPPCPRCDGTGLKGPCSKCGGTGHKLGFGNTLLECPNCQGHGIEQCPDCQGHGFLPSEEDDEIPY